MSAAQRRLAGEPKERPDLFLSSHIGDSGVAGNNSRSSCMLDFFAVLVLCGPMYQSVSWSFQNIFAQPPRQGASHWKDSALPGHFNR